VGVGEWVRLYNCMLMGCGDVHIRNVLFYQLHN